MSQSKKGCTASNTNVVKMLASSESGRVLVFLLDLRKWWLEDSDGVGHFDRRNFGGQCRGDSNRPWPTALICWRRSQGTGAPNDFPTHQRELILGRDESADIPMPSAKCSRLHATLTLKSQEYTIRDRDSRHGVLLNGVNVHAAVLRDGDLLQLGDNSLSTEGPKPWT